MRREINVWGRLRHDHIIPLYGVTYGFGPLPAMVCPWVENGNLTGHLNVMGEGLSLVERFQIVRGATYSAKWSSSLSFQLCDVASGLSYRTLFVHFYAGDSSNTFSLVHSLSVIHGDLTGVIHPIYVMHLSVLYLTL